MSTKVLKAPATPPAPARHAHIGGLEVAGELRRLVGVEATWTPSGPGSRSSFDSWVSRPKGSASAPTLMSSAVTMNCWEMILLAAYRVNRVDWAWLHDLYTDSMAMFQATFVRSMAPNGLHVLDLQNPKGLRPLPGEIVVWGEAAHIALATGLRDGDGRHHVYSFWPPTERVKDGMAVEPIALTTIEELSARKETKDARVVSCGDGPWAAPRFQQDAEVT